MGDFTVRAHFLGLNHGMGLTIFTIPERQADYIADLVTPNRVMFSVVPDFNIRDWERSLGENLKMDFDSAVCSHNERPLEQAMAGCTRTHVEEERQFICDLRNAILVEFEKGTGFFSPVNGPQVCAVVVWRSKTVFSPSEKSDAKFAGINVVLS